MRITASHSHSHELHIRADYRSGGGTFFQRRVRAACDYRLRISTPRYMLMVHDDQRDSAKWTDERVRILRRELHTVVEMKHD